MEIVSAHPFQTVFKRYELKYMLTEEQRQRLLSAMEPYMKPDKFGRSTIRNLYFDTDSYLLIRRSIEKPVYKEKLRVRSYSRACGDIRVFVELKKKYKHVVYKRRMSMTNTEAISGLTGDTRFGEDTQISREIEYFLDYYGRLSPKVYLCYDRQAYYARDKSDLRITFDDNILCRQNELTLDSEPYGEPILEKGMVLMEIKCSAGIPLWLTSVLSKEKIYKTSFSKYGTAYQRLIFPKLYGTHTEKREVNTNA